MSSNDLAGSFLFEHRDATARRSGYVVWETMTRKVNLQLQYREVIDLGYIHVRDETSDVYPS